jgi:hypothetical protein
MKKIKTIPSRAAVVDLKTPLRGIDLGMKIKTGERV